MINIFKYFKTLAKVSRDIEKLSELDKKAQAGLAELTGRMEKLNNEASAMLLDCRQKKYDKLLAELSDHRTDSPEYAAKQAVIIDLLAKMNNVSIDTVKEWNKPNYG